LDPGKTQMLVKARMKVLMGTAANLMRTEVNLMMSKEEQTKKIKETSA
jgi:hypothetical protein